MPREDTQFEPGKSGNPGGRSKSLTEFRAKLATLDETAFETMQAALKDANGKVRMMALKEFYDRRWGKATQAVELTGAGGGPVQHFDLAKATPEQLEQLRKLALAITGNDDGGRVIGELMAAGAGGDE